MLEHLEELTESGVPEGQAKAHLRVLRKLIDDNLATKHDIELVRHEIELVRHEIELVRKDMKEIELKIENTASRQTIVLGGILVTGLFVIVALAKLGLLTP